MIDPLCVFSNLKGELPPNYWLARVGFEARSTHRAPQVVSIRIPMTPPVVSSFFFDKNNSSAGALFGNQNQESAQKKHERRVQKTANRQIDSKSATRIRPPRDVIKLEDRLYYLLQPPLESFVDNGTIDLPFKPFAYQFAGIAFLFPRHSAILADEMGLGKTMQAISSIRLLLRSGQIKQVLLICPKPLVTNWIKEFALWAPEIPICVIQGDQKKRSWQWCDAAAPVKIANYELMNRDSEIIVNRQVNFDLVVLDEAQRIKNRHGATSKAVRSVPRSRSWALTGTPVENSTSDLVGIFEFLSSGYLNEQMSTRKMRLSVRDFILRRTKSEVMTDLPPLLNRDAMIELLPDQLSTYDQAESQGVINLNQMDQITIQHVFELVLRLKQICNFDPVTGNSAKMERLHAELEEVVASGHKAIVFSQWVGTLKQIAKQTSQLNPLEYHGKIPQRQRDSILSEFKDNPERHVLLMSYGAGSVGLNLQFCRYVFLFDQWWNPAVEDQAINRAHRIGSTGSVTVTRMISQSTIEERINQVLEDKRELFRQILSNTDQPAHVGLSRDEIFGLFQLRADGKPLSSVA